MQVAKKMLVHRPPILSSGQVEPLRAAASTAHASRGCNNRQMPERLEVQRAVAVSAGEIFAALRDPRGHVTVDSPGMLMAASGDLVAQAGDTFVVHMDREALNDRQRCRDGLGCRRLT